MFCPKCKAEYRVGFLRCSDCHVDLIEHPPVEKPAAEEAKVDTTFGQNRFEPDLELVVIRTFQNGLDADLAKSVLEAAGIESIIRGDDTARRYYPMAQGLDLLVLAQDAEDAVKILETDATDQAPY